MSKVTILRGSSRAAAAAAAAVAEGTIAKMSIEGRSSSLVRAAPGRFFSAQAPLGLPLGTPNGGGSNYWYKCLAAVAVPVGVAVVLGSASFAEERQQSQQRQQMRSDDLEPPTIEDFYILDSGTLGRGQFGTVCPAVDRATGEVVAVKCVPRCKQTEEHVAEEIEAHRQAGKHPNIVGLKGVFAAEDCWYIVMEFASGGELYEHLTSNAELEQWEARDLLREIAEAVAHLHSRGVVHGDLKPENLLLREPPEVKRRHGVGAGADKFDGDGAGPEETHDACVAAGSLSVGSTYRGTGGGLDGAMGGGGGEVAARTGTSGSVLLADFGSSFMINNGGEGGANGGVGDGVQGGPRAAKEYTVAYSAPEVVCEGSMDQSADVWSLGVIAYVMVKGRHPFDPNSEADEDEIVDNVVNSEPDWTGLDPQAADLIRKMLSRNPNDRPSAREVRDSSWLQVTERPHSC